MDVLKVSYPCHYEEKDTIGKRYRRHDAIGTPFCITVDHESLSDNTVTVRHRDSMQQERVSIDNLEKLIESKVAMKTLF
jgi:glycyl-tRNA synthetase